MKQWMIVALVVLGLLMFSNFAQKEAGAMLRSFSADPVRIDSDVIITYTASNAGFNAIEDTLEPGWGLVTSDPLVTLNDNVLRAAWTGDSISIVLKAPSTVGTYTFSGIFEGTSGLSGNIGGASQIVVNDCTSHSTTACLGDDIYYYDSCGTQEEIKESCTWQCNVATCQRNTIADTNNDGTLSLSELITYAQQWIDNAGVTLSEVISVAEVWVSPGTSNPVDIPGE